MCLRLYLNIVIFIICNYFFVNYCYIFLWCIEYIIYNICMFVWENFLVVVLISCLLFLGFYLFIDYCGLLYDC